MSRYSTTPTSDIGEGDRYGRLHLAVNEIKSAVASVFGRKFLGYAFWVGPGGVVKRRVANKAIGAFKDRIRELTPRVTGRGLRAVTERLRIFMLGWKAYFRLAQSPGVWRTLDQWVRHRLRAIQLKQWRRGVTIFRELMALGAKTNVATQVAGNARRWWRNSGMLLNSVLTIRWADQLGVPRLALPQSLEPPGADPHAGWCGRGAIVTIAPYADSAGPRATIDKPRHRRQ